MISKRFFTAETQRPQRKAKPKWVFSASLR